jgi:putative copper resistance protein D
VEAALALCRFAHFLAAMVAFGASAYLWLLTPAALRRELSVELRRVVLVAGVVVLLSAILWVALESAAMADDWSGVWNPEMLQGVLFDTAFGRLWQARLVLCAVLAAALAVRADNRWGLRTGLAALTLASLGLTGHAAMQTGGLGALHRGADALHLLCGGAWIGGLLPFALCLLVCSRPELRGEAVTAMMRYSRYGHFFVALIVLSGVTNVALTSGALPFPPSSPYRALLLAKIALVACLVALAVVNRYVIVSRWGTDEKALRALRATSMAEIALAAVIVGLVSLFGLLDPA